MAKKCFPRKKRSRAFPVTSDPSNPFRERRLREADERSRRLGVQLFVALAIVGTIVGWGKRRLPERDAQPTPVAEQSTAPDEASATAETISSAERRAPDLQLYREVVAEVRLGRNYYDVARERLPKFGFPINSPLNWRLPTYAWLFSLAPSPFWIQGALVTLSLAALALAFVAEQRRSNLLGAIVVTLMLIGVVRWSIDGEAFYTQEVWAAVLILLSFAAYALDWRKSAAVIGTVALLFRELALPYCFVAGAVALYRRRWSEAALWCGGIVLFGGFAAWHAMQVKAQLAGLGEAGSTDLAQWLRCGGLDFVLLTSRMNGLLFAAPAVVLWLYLLSSLMGLAAMKDDASRVACFAATGYVLAFAILGRPENFCWGLMYAPLLPWGLAALPRLFAPASTPSAALTRTNNPPTASPPFGEMPRPFTIGPHVDRA